MISFTGLKESVVIVHTGIDAHALRVLSTNERIVSLTGLCCISNSGMAIGRFNITLLLDEGRGIIVAIPAPQKKMFFWAT